MAKAIDAVSFLVCLNIAVWLLGQSNIEPLIGMDNAFNPSSFAILIIGAAVSGMAALKAGGGTNFIFVAVFWAGLGVMWTQVYNLVVGFPSFLIDLGTPTMVVWALYALFAWLIFTWVFGLLSGREVTT